MVVSSKSSVRLAKRNFPYATLGLIILNVIIALVTIPNSESSNPDGLFSLFGFIPNSPHATTAVTSLFLHANTFHLLTNMVFLWLFASHVESAIGPIPTLCLYLLGGVASVGAHWGAAVFSAPSAAAHPLIGASGAVSAIIGYFTLRFYKSGVKMELGKHWRMASLWIPVWLTALGWIGLQTAGAVAALIEHRSDNIGYWAHIGGFAFGLLVGAVWRAGNVGEREYALEQAEDALRVSNPATALNHLRPLLHNTPEDVEALALAGSAWDQLGDEELMTKDWVKAVRFGLETGHFEVAKECAVQLNQRGLLSAITAPQLYRLGCLCFDIDDPNIGLPLLETLVGMPIGTYERENALLKLSDYYRKGSKSPERAKKLLQLYIRDYPNSEYVSTAQNWLKQL